MLRRIRKNYRRLVAFMLTLAMTFTNIGTNLNVAFAAGEDVDALFLVDGSDLEEAIQDAVESGDTFDFSSLELKAKTKSLKTSYEKLIGGKNGAAYQLDVDVDDSYAPEGTSMEVFYNAGTEEVVFLFINESDLIVRFRANVDGYETAGVTINPNAANVEDSDASYVEDYSSTTMIDDTSKKISGEVLNPTTEAAEENAATDSEESEEAAEESGEAAEDVSEEAAEPAEDAAEAAEQTEEASVEETAEAETEEASEEAKAEEAAAEEDTPAEIPEEADEEEAAPEEGAAIASISLHKIQQVASNVTVLDDEDEIIVIETEEVPLDEEPEITEDSNVEIEVEDETEAEVETEAESETETETAEEPETEAAEEASEENTEAEDTGLAIEDEDAAEADEIIDETPVKVEEAAPVASDSNASSDHTSTKVDDEQLLEDDITDNALKVLGDLDGKAFNTVTIWGSANARAVKVALEDLGGITLDGYRVDYSVDPVGAADIKGAETVSEGESLFFYVDPQVGYDLVEVTANGEALEAIDAAEYASASNMAGHAYVYVVEDVEEDLEILASLVESDGATHPEFSYSKTLNGVKVDISAEEGILPAGTQAEVKEVTAHVEDVVKEKVEQDAGEAVEVTSVLAYDITLYDADGNKLDDSWSRNGYVNVAFSGAKIEANSKEADTVEVMHVDTDVDATKKTVAAEDVAKVEKVAETVVVEGEKSISKVEFEAEHFSVYAVSFQNEIMPLAEGNTSYTITVGQTLTLPATSAYYNEWSSSDSKLVTVSSSGTVTGANNVSGGTVTITHKYRMYGQWQTETFTVTLLTRVYVYVKLDTAAGIDTTGWNINKDGWYTIGYVDLDPSVVPSASTLTSGNYYPDNRPAVIAALPKIHYYEPNKAVALGIDLSAVNWNANGYGLKVADGASDYADEADSGSKQWHLDGLVQISRVEEHTVTIHYVYADGTIACEDHVEKVKTGTTVKVTSPSITGYTPNQAEVSVTVLKNDVVVTVIYTIQQTTTSVSGTKTWDMIKGETYPAITIQLLRDDVVADSVVLTDGKATYSFEDLPVYAVGTIEGYGGSYDEHIFEYSVEEVAVPGYTTTQVGNNFTNTADKTFVEVTKTWQDGEENPLAEDQIPESLEVTLLRNGVAYGGSAFLSKTNNWSYKFENLPTHDANGIEYSYSVKETLPHGYVANAADTADTVLAELKVAGNIKGGYEAKLVNVKSTETPIAPTKSHTITSGRQAEGTVQMVEVGGTVVYTISYYNHKNTAANVTITDTLPVGLEHVSSEPAATVNGQQLTWNMESVTPFTGGQVTVTAKVTNAALNGSDPKLENTAQVWLDDVESSTNKDTVTVYNPNWTVEKTVAVAKKDGNTSLDTAEVGDTLNYTVKVQNTGNTVVKDADVSDEITVDGKKKDVVLTLSNPEADTVVYENGKLTLAVGKTATFTASYVVGVKDKSITNNVSVGGKTDQVTTDVKAAPNWTVAKKLTNTGSEADGKFKAGDKATFDITVENTGNVSLNNVTVDEKLAGAMILESTDGSYEVRNTQAVIASLGVGEKATVKAEYTVTQKEVDEGKGTNTALVDAVEMNQATVTADFETVAKKPQITAEKSVEEDKKYAAGETAYFAITVTNSGNTTLKNVTVTEMQSATIMPGEDYEVSDGKAIIAEMKPGNTVAVKAQYVVTQADVDANANGAKNTATVSGKGWKPGDQDPVSVNVEAEIKVVDQNAAFKAEKAVSNTGSGVNGSFKVNETANFTITITNTGNVTLSEVKVAEELKDAVLTSGTGYEISNGAAVIKNLAPNGSVVVYASYKVTQEDVDNGGTENVVTVTAKGPAGGTLDSQEAKAQVATDEQKPDVKTTKTIINSGKGENGKFKAGDKVEFEITVENAGNVTLNNVTVTEGLEGAVIARKLVDTLKYQVSEDKKTATIAKLDVREKVVVNAEYTVTQDDVDAGNLKNIATVKIPGKNDPQYPEVQVPTEDKKPSLAVEKVLTNVDEATGIRNENGEESSAFKAGETAKFNIIVSNNGTVTLKNVTVVESLEGAVILDADDGSYTVTGNQAAIAELEVGKSVTVKAQYTVAQADVDAGGAENVVAAEGEGPSPEDQKPEKKEAKAEIPTEDKDSKLEASKKLTNRGTGEDGKFKKGEIAEFAITVKNTGNTTLKNVTVGEMDDAEIIADENLYSINEEGKAVIAKLEAGAQVIVKAQYKVTQADVDNGGVTNVATVESHGPNPSDPDPEPEDPKEPIPTDSQKPSFYAEKKLTNAAEAGGTKVENGVETKAFKAGETAKFDITVTNDGNVTLKNVLVQEKLKGAKLLSGSGYSINENGEAVIAELAVGDTAVVTAEYTVTQADVDAGSAENVANVTGHGPNSSVPDPDPAELKEPIPVEDPKPSFTSVKTLTNIDEATGTKVVDGEETKAFKARDIAKFDITVTNDGNVTLKNIIVTEKLAEAKILDGSGYIVNKDGNAVIDTLGIGEKVIVKAQYVVTQADVDGGNITNVAAVTGEGPVDPDPEEPEEPIPTEDPHPSFKAQKIIENEGTGEGGSFKVGETVNFKISVTNDGNVTLKNVAVAETLDGAEILPGNYKLNEAKTEAVIAEIAVSETKDVYVAYKVTQADVDAGGVTNVATVTGEGPNPDGPAPEPKQPEVSVTTDERKPSAVTSKTLTNEGSGNNGSFKAGETAEFDISVRNTGNVTLRDVVVSEMEDAVIVEGEGYTVNANGQAVIASMEVNGEAVIVKAVYQVTQADVDAGVLKNIATVKIPGKDDPQDPEVTIPTEEKAPSFKAEKLLVNAEAATGIKIVEGEETKAFKAGETAEFDIKVTNDGNVTLKNIVVSEMEGASIEAGKGYTINGKGQAVIDVLAVEDTVTVKAVYKVTQADVDAGGARNLATVEGKGPKPEDPDPEPKNPEEPIPTEDAHPSFKAEKSLVNAEDATGIRVVDGKETKAFKAGETAKFDIKVTNDGNVTLKNIVVKEMEGAEITANGDLYGINEMGEAEIAELAVGSSVIVEATYKVTQADVDAGGVTNIVTVNGEGSKPEDPDPTPEKPEEPIPTEDEKPSFVSKKVLTNLEEATGIKLVDGKETKAFKAGDVAKFDITIRNDGNVTLTNIIVSEMEGAEIVKGENYVVMEDGQAEIGKLAVGEEVVVKAIYTVTQKDIDNGGVKNIATVTGAGSKPEDPDPTPEAPEEPIPTEDLNGHLTITKKATKIPANGKTYALGEKVEYEIVVTNDGNLTLTEVTVKDALTKAEWKAGTLAPEEFKVYTTEYTVTEDDIKAGKVVNEATAIGASPDPDQPEVVAEPGIAVVDTDQQNPSLNVKKVVTNQGFDEGTTTFNKGATITYAITVTNTGNVTLENILVKDECDGAGKVELKKDGMLGTNLFADYTVDGTQAIIGSLAPGRTVTIECSYVVVSADNGKKIVNTATATAGSVTDTDLATATAVYTYKPGGSSGPSGGGSSSRPSGTSTSTGGPGVPTTTIDPDAVPLAGLPTDNSEILAMIDDEDVPLAALPKTGQSGSASLMLMLSSMMLAAFAVVTRKKEDKQ